MSMKRERFGIQLNSWFFNMETSNTEYPIGPHCGYENKESQWLDILATGDYSLLIRCEPCSKEYKVKASVSEIVFTTTK